MVSVNRQKLNRLNRITIVAKDISDPASNDGKTDDFYDKLQVGHKGEQDWLYFTAYLNNNIALSAANEFGDLMGDFGLGNLLSLGVNKLGYVPAFSMNRAVTYQGASVVSMALDCTLKAFDNGKSYRETIIEPIQSLAKIAFPKISTTGGKVNDLKDFAGNLATEWSKSDSSFMQFLAYVADGADKVVNWVCDNVKIVDNIAKSTKLLELPVSVKAPVAVYYGDPDNQKQPNIKLGPFYVKSVSVSLGKLIITPGLPELVNVTIGLESSRTTDSDMFNKLITINE